MQSATLTDTERETERKFLISLHMEIWKPYTAVERFNISRTSRMYTAYELKRQLTKKEFERVKKAAKNFVVVPHNTNYGFNFGITMYDIPVCFGIQPDTHLISLEGHHLPEGIRGMFEDAWKHFSPLSHNKSNEQILRYYEMQPPREKRHYEY